MRGGIGAPSERGRAAPSRADSGGGRVTPIMQDRSGPLSVTVAVLTRQRPRMLAATLDSFDALAAPDSCTVRFLVVENDDAPRSREVVEARGGRLALGPLDYVLETEPGIPFGRNRAAREASAAGSDLLAFVDDDETVDRDWLRNLLRGYRRSTALLLGAPLRAAPVAPGLSWAQRKIHEGIAARYARKEHRAARRADLAGTPGVTIVTNNWLADLTIFRDHGIWFDEEMRFTGGTDAKLSAEVDKRGLPTAWVADAVVYETIPPDRLTFGYQFRRGRDQSNTHMRRKLAQSPAGAATVLVSVPAKLAGAVLLAVALLPTGGRSLLDLARTCGWIAGRIGALRGHRSELYENVTGS